MRLRSLHLSARVFGLVAFALAFSPLAAGQAATGTIEFFVAATPTGGRAQPAPRLPVYLLSKSFAQIQAEAEKDVAAVDLATFVDTLDLSPELKAWMKKHKTVRLSGQDFTRQVTTADVMDVPEFWEAYLSRNAGDVSVGFPRAKFKESSPDKNPEKYELERKEFRDRVKKYLTTYQHTKEGMDLHLMGIDSAQRWARRESERKAEVQQRVLLLAQSTYLVAKGETDLQGRGGFVRVPAGSFWLSTLENEALAGDVHLRWDVQVHVREGAATQVELSNVNALPRIRR